jgi:hypothetical protein
MSDTFIVQSMHVCLDRNYLWSIASFGLEGKHKIHKKDDWKKVSIHYILLYKTCV